MKIFSPLIILKSLILSLLMLYFTASTASEFVDNVTTRHNIKACPPGSYITGINIQNNQLNCTTDADIPFFSLLKNQETIYNGMRCPAQTVATGFDNSGKILCTKFQMPFIAETTVNTIRNGIKSCKENDVVTGIIIGINKEVLQCKTPEQKAVILIYPPPYEIPVIRDAISAKKNQTAILKTNQKLTSKNKQVITVMQADGNLSSYKANCFLDPSCMIWSTKLPGKINDYFLTLKDNGNMIITRGTVENPKKIIWTNNVNAKKANYTLISEDNEKLNIYKGLPPNLKQVVWTNADGGQPPEPSIPIPNDQLASCTCVQNGIPYPSGKTCGFAQCSARCTSWNYQIKPFCTGGSGQCSIGCK